MSIAAKRTPRRRVDGRPPSNWQIRYDTWVSPHNPEWMRIRYLIFKRCGGICEGCGMNKATQVHNFTYVNLGHEFLWELRGVCDPCHKRVHGIE
jgi:hypothetical protein